MLAQTTRESILRGRENSHTHIDQFWIEQRTPFVATKRREFFKL